MLSPESGFAAARLAAAFHSSTVKGENDRAAQPVKPSEVDLSHPGPMDGMNAFRPASGNTERGSSGFDLRDQRQRGKQHSTSNGIGHQQESNPLPAPLAGQNLSRADLRFADLRNQQLGNAITQQFPFRADLKGVNLTGTDLSGIISDRSATFSSPFDARGAVYNRKTIFPEGFQVEEEGLILLEPGTDVSGQNFTHMPLSGMNLQKVRFTGSLMRKSNLYGSDLSGADLSHAWLQGSDLRDIVTNTETRFIGARYSDATQFSVGFNPAQYGMILDNPASLSSRMRQGEGNVSLMDFFA